VDKFTRLEQLLNIPKVLPNSAKLAKTSGSISKIEYDPSVNGHNIYIGKEKHFVPAQRKIEVEVGTKVEKGQKLTDGNINPRELLPLKGINAVQDYLTDELYDKIYKSEDVRRRNIEVVTRNLTNYTKVADPGSSHYLINDTVQISKVNEYNNKAGPLQEKIQHQPILMSSKLIAENKDEDYLSRLNFQHLKDNLLSAAQRSWKTHSKGMNPIGPYAMGTLGSDKLPGY
jgi:DNA-directed RNA polymerase subunit beta'